MAGVISYCDFCGAPVVEEPDSPKTWHCECGGVCSAATRYIWQKGTRAVVIAACSRVEFGLLLPNEQPFVKVTPDEEPFIEDICRKLYLDYPECLFSGFVTNELKWYIRSNKNGRNVDVLSICKEQGAVGNRDAVEFMQPNAR